MNQTWIGHRSVMSIKKMRFSLGWQMERMVGENFPVNVEHETSTNSLDFSPHTRQCVSKQNTNANIFY
jgi:hypothetical protein